MRRNGFVRVALAVSLLSLPAAAGVVFDNFPVAGSINGWSIGAATGDAVTDSFTLGSETMIKGANLGVWLYSGDSLTDLFWSVGTTPFGFELGGTPGSSTPALTTLAAPPDYAGSNPNNGWDIGVASFLFESPLVLNPGTYYLTIIGADTTSAADVYWDQHDYTGTNAKTWVPPYTPGDVSSIGGAMSFQVLGDPVPEPATYLMLGSGLILAGNLKRWFFRRRA